MRESYDDVIGCIVQSLNDNFVDYCYNSHQLNEVIKRWDKEGKRCFIYKKFFNKYGELNYYKLIPVKCYIKQDNVNLKQKKLAVDYYNIPKHLRLTAGACRQYFIIKEFEENIMYDSYSRAVRLIESRDE